MVDKGVEADKRGRIGSRGCPNCGGHNTEGLRGDGRSVYWCRTCRHRWFPCRPHCRGYALALDAPTGPEVRGCDECGVPTVVARGWPEAYRSLANELGRLKKRALGVGE